ncbi:trypsin-like peptidase domain-containing protein [Aestuariivirga sp.]|uniref:trypsin-like peptidase domain-containing protein n=1 Tax=Aestuariivirga sp. TaxID=2650926 RepID=UPI0039E39A8F
MKKSVLVVLSGLALTGCVSTPDADLESRNIQVDENAVPASAAAPAGISGLVSASGPSYVTLTVSESDQKSGTPSKDARAVALTSGSGFIVDPSGYVMTAAHVAVKPGYTVSARAANGRIYSGTVVDVLPTNDMALIKLKGFSGKAVSPTSNQCVVPGSVVYSLGKPHAQGDTARVGTLQAMHFGRPVSYGQFGYPDALVLHLGTQKGESGGPLFNQQGQLIGMVVSTLTDSNGNLLNLAHAVPAPALAGFLCSHVSCSAQWTALAAKPTSACPSG